jgi:hypothetical protein
MWCSPQDRNAERNSMMAAVNKTAPKITDKN